MAYKKWIIPGTNDRGQSMSIEKENRQAPYVATLWERGIPVARKPVPDDRALAIIAELSAINL